MADKLYEFAITFKTDDKAAIASLKRFQKQLHKTETAKKGVSKEGRKFGKVMGDVTRGTTALGGRFSRMGAGLRALVSPISMVVLALTALVAVTIKSAKAFTDAWDEAQRLNIILGDELRPTFGKIRNDLEKIAIETGVAFQVLIKDFKDLTRTTQDYDRSLRLVAGGAKLAAISGSELKDVTRANLRMTEIFTELKGKEARLLDAVAFMYRKSETDLGIFSEAMGRVAPSVKAGNVQWEEFLALITFVLRKTGKTSDAMTSLRAMMQVFGLEQKKGIDSTAEMGQLFGSQALRAKGLTKMFEDLTKGIALSPNSFLKQIYRVIPALEAANIGALLLGEKGFGEYKTILDEVRNSQGQLNQMWGKTNNMWGIAFGRIRELSGAFTRRLGGALLENSGLLGWLSNQIENNLDTWLEWGTKTGEFLKNVGLLIGGLVKALIFVGRVARVAFLPWIYAFKVLMFLIGKVSGFLGRLSGQMQFLFRPGVEQLQKMAAMAPGALRGQVVAPSPRLALLRPLIGGTPRAAVPPGAPSAEPGANAIVNEIQGLRNEINKLAQRPIRTDINIDGEKVASSVSRTIMDDARERGHQLPIGTESGEMSGIHQIGVPAIYTDQTP